MRLKTMMRPFLNLTSVIDNVIYGDGYIFEYPSD